MRIDVLTLFPEVLEPFFDASILGRARRAGLAELVATNLRDFAHDSRRSVDDKPFGGGPGMVLMAPIVFEAVEGVEAADPRAAHRVLLSPQGTRFDQATARRFAGMERLLLIAGHYEGFDERVRRGLGAEEVSIGDYVLSGGEAAALVVVDAVVRLLPGALGAGEVALADESFNDGLLEYPQYTRPRAFRGMSVPDVLVSGDHQAVERWRREQAQQRTRRRRPDLLQDNG